MKIDVKHLKDDYPEGYRLLNVLAMLSGSGVLGIAVVASYADMPEPDVRRVLNKLLSLGLASKCLIKGRLDPRDDTRTNWNLWDITQAGRDLLVGKD